MATGFDCESEITVAGVQMRPVVGAMRANVETNLARIEESAANGSRLAVLPELANSGYRFADRGEAFARTEEAPAGETTVALIDIARRHHLDVVAGYGRTGRYRPLQLRGRRQGFGLYRHLPQDASVELNYNDHLVQQL